VDDAEGIALKAFKAMAIASCVVAVVSALIAAAAVVVVLKGSGSSGCGGSKVHATDAHLITPKTPMRVVPIVDTV
jgi:hypothetical protein